MSALIEQLRRGACAAVACAAALFAHGAAAESVNEILELTPYRIRLVTVFDERPEWTALRRDEIRSYLLARADSVIGAPWDVKLLPVLPAMEAYLSERLESFSDGGLPDAWLDLPAEKILIVRFSGDGGGFKATGREFDVRTQLWGTAAPRAFAQLERAGDEAFAAALDAFAPIGEISAVDEKDKKNITVTFRAGELPILDPAISLVEAADVLRPVIRFNDSTGKPRKIQPIEWTLLRVEKVEGASAQCKLHTSARNPISGKRRVEQLALAINRVGTAPTTLKVLARTPDARPLAGYGVYDYDAEKSTSALLGLTDRHGEFDLQPTPGLMQTVAIRSGGETLARLVVAPGLQPALTVRIADDDRRLQVEGFIVGLQEQIVDWAVQREILVSRARELIDNGKEKEALMVLAELTEVQRRQNFSERLAQQRAARSVADVNVQRKIDKLFADTKLVLDKYLYDRDVRELERRIAESK